MTQACSWGKKKIVRSPDGGIRAEDLILANNKIFLQISYKLEKGVSFKCCEIRKGGELQM